MSKIKGMHKKAIRSLHTTTPDACYWASLSAQIVQWNFQWHGQWAVDEEGDDENISLYQAVHHMHHQYSNLQNRMTGVCALDKQSNCVSGTHWTLNI